MRNINSSIALMSAMVAMSGLAGLPINSSQAGMSVSSSHQTPTKKAPAQQDQQRRTTAVRRMSGGGLTKRDLFGGGPGWTNKHVQRMAAKKRNVKRSRKSGR